MEGDAQVPVVITEESVTTQAEIGEMTVRVYLRAGTTDPELWWHYDIAWRGLLLWWGIEPRERGRHHAEAKATRTARRLGMALARAHEAGGGPPATLMTYGWPSQEAKWVAVPSRPEESAQ